MRALLSTVLILLLATSVTACGFRLRGALQLPAGMEQITINSGSSGQDLAQTLRRTLAGAGIHAEEDAGSQHWQLDILDETLTKRAISLSRNVRTAEYGLELSARWQLRNPDGDTVVAANTVRSQATYRHDNDNLSGKTREEQQLIGEMRQYLARQILLRIERAHETAPAAVETP